ncbi:VOC family protein [Gallaecimonas kandeliae]|uniref:VOC family protein n=1 Tax=Gallaecimonas kandeliae TaxID=3029055 RepID=UPI0026475222|nr:VOC family protein [Gallaecimonas kandeliae]WKE66432.1 VOC family protein [Gallaecimonas kandeliae]
MTQTGTAPLPTLRLGHIELLATDIDAMEAFYRLVLGLVVTDRGNGMVFLSRHPDEHHQIVLSPGAGTRGADSPLDHIAFRVDSLAQLRQYHGGLVAAGQAFSAVSHGNSWSLYFLDPEGNRLEIYCPTPWHVSQPCRFPIDLSLDDTQLLAYCRAKVQDLPGFTELARWAGPHQALLES